MANPTHDKRQNAQQTECVGETACVEDRSSSQEKAGRRCTTLAHRLAAKHVAADAPIGLSGTNGKTAPASTSDLPGHFDRASTNAYRSTSHSHASSYKCHKRRSICAKVVGPPSLVLRSNNLLLCKEGFPY